MIKSILTAAGVAHRRGRFPKPPGGTFAVYTDDITTDGPDGLPRILRHDVTVELYEPLPNDGAEAAIENAMTAAGLFWTKQDRLWLQSEQLYQVVYEFAYTEKRRI